MLTHNRTSFEDLLPQEVLRAKKSGEICSKLMRGRLPLASNGSFGGRSIRVEGEPPNRRTESAPGAMGINPVGTTAVLPRGIASRMPPQDPPSRDQGSDFADALVEMECLRFLRMF